MSKDTVNDNKIEQPKKEMSSQDKMINGSAWMTGGSILSRLLGALYIIPWMAWMGNQDSRISERALYDWVYTVCFIFKYCNSWRSICNC